MTFNRLFRQISPEEIEDDAFTLAGKVFPVITAGREDHYNSMTGSGGGFGVLFRKPAAWCIFREDRYTLELIKKERTYTLSYFPEEYRKQVLFLGKETGRNGDKMKKVDLTAVRTPSGNMSFKEARLIVECSLVQITTPGLDDFYTQESKDYVLDAYNEEKLYRKYVFGEITRVWIKNKP